MHSISYPRTNAAYWTTCHKGSIPKRTPLAERLSFFGSDAADEDIDPGAPRLFEYVQANESSGAIPGSPPASRYHADTLGSSGW